jgi:hypothetical protein
MHADANESQSTLPQLLALPLSAATFGHKATSPSP